MPVTVSGSMKADVEISCVRCLEAFHRVVDREFEVAYLRAGVGPGVDESELDEKDLDLDYYPEEGIDLQQVLREQLILWLPMKPLCRPECEGLCLQCGANLNQVSCSCEPEVDPRLASLKTIRDQL